MAIKKATSGKRADKLAAAANKLLKKTPVNKDQVAALKQVKKSVAVFERAGAAVVKEQQKLDARKEKVKASTASYRQKKTQAAKSALEKARAAAVAAAEGLAAAKSKLREQAAQLKDDMAAVAQAEKKEIAKNKAIATFAAQWEKRYDRMMARKAKKKAARQKKAALKRKRAAAAKSAAKKAKRAPVAKATPAKPKAAPVKARAKAKPARKSSGTTGRKAAAPKKRTRAGR